MKIDEENENKIRIPPVGLINYSRINQRYKNNFYSKDLDLPYLYNVCYMNASIQCLFRLNEFVRRILKFDGGNLTRATQNLIKNIQKSTGKKELYSVFEIKKAMAEKDEIYENNKEEDVNEFISNYLSYLIEETKNTGDLKEKWRYSSSDQLSFTKFYEKFQKKRGNSFVLDLFYGLLRTENYCKKCRYTFSIKFNAFNIFEIPIKEDKMNCNPLKMQDLLKEFISEKYNFNEICSVCKRNIYYKTSINSLPQCLIIYFTRDYSDNKSNNIIIPKSFNFSRFMNEKLLKEDDNYFYNLKGIIYYQYFKGNISHYRSACLVDDSKWYYFDDNSFETDKTLRIYTHDNPVFLFYEK